MRVSVEFIGLAFFIYLFAIERNLHCPCMSIWNLYSILSNVREKEIFFVRFVLLLLLLFIVVVVDSPLVTINLIINFPSHSLQSCNIFARYLFAMLRFRRFFLFSFCFLLLSSIFSVICVNGQSWIAQTFKHTHTCTHTLANRSKSKDESKVTHLSLFRKQRQTKWKTKQIQWPPWEWF